MADTDPTDLWTGALAAESLLFAVDSEHHYALHTNRGAALERLGRLEDAIEAYDAALQSKVDHVEALHNRGVALKALKRNAEALASFDRAISYNADFYPSWRGKTDVLTLLERFPEAIVAATEAHRLRPTEAGPLADRAFAQLKAKHLDASLKDYDEAKALGDNSSETKRLHAIALSQRAVELDKEGKLELAEEYYTKAIQYEATESRVFNRAFLYMRTNRVNDAIDGYRQVMSMSPNNFQARAALGTLLLQRDRFPEAACVLAEAAALNPSASDVIYNLGYARLKTDELDDAEKLFNQALALEPSMENAKTGLEAIAALRSQDSKPKYKLEIGASIEPKDEATQATAPAPSDASAKEPEAASATQAVADVSVTPSTGSASADAVPSTLLTTSTATEKPAVAKRTSMARPFPTAGAVATKAPTPAAAEPKSAGGSPSARFAVNEDGADGRIHTYAELKAPGPYPDGIVLTHREAYMSLSEFTKVVGSSKTEFYAFPKWKRVQLRKQLGLF